MTCDEILAKFNKVKRQKPNQYMALCPAHEDHNPSLSIKFDDSTGKVLLNCFAGCNIDDICSAVNMSSSDLFLEQGKLSQRTSPKYVKGYDYHDTDGKLLYTVSRTKDKKFPVVTYNEHGELIPSIKGVKRVPYNLPKVLTAIRSNETIYIVEGEKDVDNLIKQGLAATTFQGGANRRITQEESSYLQDSKRIVIFPDNDDAGRNYVENVLTLLNHETSDIKVVDLKQVYWLSILMKNH